jgi:hypothetical protein
VSKHDSLIADAERLCEKATARPWAVHSKALSAVIGPTGYSVATCACDSERQSEWHDNAAFIAWARTGVPALVAALRESEADRERMRRGLGRLSGESPDPTVFAFWPWSLSISEVELAHRLWSGMTKIASNLLAGREWDGEVKP